MNRFVELPLEKGVALVLSVPTIGSPDYIGSWWSKMRRKASSALQDAGHNVEHLARKTEAATQRATQKTGDYISKQAQSAYASAQKAGKGTEESLRHAVVAAEAAAKKGAAEVVRKAGEAWNSIKSEVRRIGGAVGEYGHLLAIFATNPPPTSFAAAMIYAKKHKVGIAKSLPSSWMKFAEIEIEVSPHGIVSGIGAVLTPPAWLRQKWDHLPEKKRKEIEEILAASTIVAAVLAVVDAGTLEEWAKFVFNWIKQKAEELVSEPVKMVKWLLNLFQGKTSPDAAASPDAPPIPPVDEKTGSPVTDPDTVVEETVKQAIKNPDVYDPYKTPVKPATKAIAVSSGIASGILSFMGGALRFAGSRRSR